MEIAGTVRGGGYDAIDITDASGIVFGGALELTFTSLFPDNTTFDLFGFSGSPTGAFSSVTAAGSYGSLTFVRQGGVWTAQSGSQTLSFAESSGNVLVVPEPGVIALAASGLVAFTCVAFRRRFLANSAIT